ncbi:MAG: hypothetical protein J6Y26_03185 [Lachnospiraceae bacterium]|nr:hypothetical protein [Lachnospiraceae bacterium]
MPDRTNCPKRHENGNCLAIGGFCTAVPDEICEIINKEQRKYTAIFKLKDMLTAAGIPFEFMDRTNTFHESFQIIYPSLAMWRGKWDGKDVDFPVNAMCSVVEGFGTYGAEQDLLEIMGLLTPEEEENGSVTGFLTPENVFERIAASDKRRKERCGDNA